MSNEKDVPEKLHATLGASSASRWIACPGSINLASGLPNTTSVHAEEGTRAHAVAELSLRQQIDPSYFVGHNIEGGEVTEEMVEHVRTYVDYCQKLRAMPGVEVWVERAFDLSALHPPAEMYGTSDFVAYDRLHRTLYVVDLKFGQGVVVEVIDNPQLRYYGLGALLSLPEGTPVDKVVITVVQPRVGHVDGYIRSEEIDVIDLLGWSSELLAAARATQEPDAPLVAGSHCRWCKAKAVCPERREHALAVAQQEFSVIEPAKPFTPPAPERIPDEQFFTMLGQLHVLEDWTKAMWERAQGMLDRGEEVPGFKLVERRATRKWVDEGQTAQDLEEQHLLEDEIYEPRRLKGPAQIEKLLGKKKFKNTMAGSVIKKSSGLTMVSDIDARPAVIRTDGSEFGILPASTNTEPEGRD